MDDVVVVEVKTNHTAKNSPLVKALSDIRVNQISFSKYCMGRILMDVSLKQNAFKQKVRNFQKEINQKQRAL